MIAAADDAETMSIGSKEEEDIFFEGGGVPTISEAGEDKRVRAFESKIHSREVRSLQGGTSSSEREALLALYNATDGDNWNIPFFLGGIAWNTTTPSDPCLDMWVGVSCDTDNKITKLDLGSRGSFGLNGTLPSDIGLLTNLEKLDFSNNQVSGTIPIQIGLLTNLESLFFNNNQLTGPIPTQIGLLTNLEVLDFGFNQLITGMIPTQICSLLTKCGGKLQTLDPCPMECSSMSPSISIHPSALPSISSHPSISIVPSGAPSVSTVPSGAPSVSAVPSGAPSVST
eukprot:scaffold26486_cov26-Attheya_sp.AAC.1